MKWKRPPLNPECWNASWHAAAVLVLIIALSYVLRPRDLLSFIRSVLEEQG